jgi:peptide deformylase
MSIRPRRWRRCAIYPPAVDPERGFAYVSGMAVLPIIKVPDPLLRRVSAPVERVDGDVRKLIDDMFATMYKAPGVGLAAIQVAVPRQVLVMDIVKNDDEEKQPIAMINPRIVETVGDELRMHEEGCLSIPDVYAELERPNAVRVRYVDMKGKPAEMVCEGMLATVVQHEIDHLNGKLFIDHLSKLKRDIIIKKIVKAARDSETVD